MLRAIDLFSGIGGITHGLRGIVEPIAYVEKNDDARGFLARKHPNVPVFDDVCTFDATPYLGKVDIITGGWPCTGFSTAGKGTGFEHEASGLFTEVVRITKECQPKYLFLENSHTLAAYENINVIVKAFDKLEYDCRWTSCRATCVGAPHQRYRWFCLVVKKGAGIDFEIPEIEKFDWENNEPPRQIEKNNKTNKLRIGFMGNAVVPDQVRYAMALLSTLENKVLGPSNTDGYSLDGRIYTFIVKHPTRKPLNIILMPRENEASFAKICDPKKVLTKPVTKKFWATPVYSCMFSSKCPRTLTKRVSNMLSACVGFSEGGRKNWYLSAQWLTYLMGFPQDYWSCDDGLS